MPSSTFTSQFKDPKWITRDIKKLNEKTKQSFTQNSMNGFKTDDKVMVDKLTDECFQAIIT